MQDRQTRMSPVCTCGARTARSIQLEKPAWSVNRVLMRASHAPSMVRGWRQRLGLPEMLSALRLWVTPAKLLWADPCTACDGRSPIAAAMALLGTLDMAAHRHTALSNPANLWWRPERRYI